MSKLAAALQAAQPGMSRLRARGGGMDYRAATIQPESVKPSLLDSIANFAKAGFDMYQAQDQKRKDLADERSNEIIRKLTPEQRREALNNGTLLYQDDPYAMQALRTKSGRNAAYLVDDDVMQKVKNGEFRTRDEMEKYRHERLQDGAKSYAEQFGIDAEDADFQRGFNADITERNISLYGAHDAFLSEQAQKGAIVNSRVELNGVLKDPEMLRRPDSSEFFEKYINQGLTSGSIPSDAQATQLISQSFGDVANLPGGANFLMGMADRKVTLNGATSTYRELMGEEQWNALMVTAQKSQFEHDAKLTEGMRLKVNSLLLQEDPRVGWEQLQAAKAELNKYQPGEQMTPQREMLIRAEEQLQGKMAQWTAAQAQRLDEEKKGMNKMHVIDTQYQKRINGEYVSMDFKDLPANENTGEFNHSDMVNFANQKLSEIDKMDVPDAAKDRLKLKYLQADSENGPFRTAFGTLVSDASREWSAAVINDRLPDSTPAMDNLRRIRNADPSLVAALYPAQAELFLKMDLMDQYGVEPQVLVNAERLRSSRTKEMQFEDDKAFEAALNDRKFADIARLPTQLRNGARAIYDATKHLTGNADMAMEQTKKFLSDNTHTFSNDDVEGETIGVIPKNMLRVNDDPKSWEQGAALVEEARVAFIKQRPWITGQQVSISAQGDSIFITAATGERIRTDSDTLQRMWRHNQEHSDNKAREEALKDANKRSPMAAVNKSKEVTKKRIVERRKRGYPTWRKNQTK